MNVRFTFFLGAQTAAFYSLLPVPHCLEQFAKLIGRIVSTYLVQYIIGSGTLEGQVSPRIHPVARPVQAESSGEPCFQLDLKQMLSFDDIASTSKIDSRIIIF